MSAAHGLPLDRPAREMRRSVLSLHDLAWMLRETMREWNRDRAQRLGASLAFYTLLSLAPLLVVVVAVVALVFGRQAAQGQLAAGVASLMGSREADLVQSIVAHAYKPAIGLLATAVSIVTLGFSASSVAAELQDAMNTIWHVPAKPDQSFFCTVVSFVKERFFSLAVVLSGGILLLISVALSTWIAAVGGYFHSTLLFPETTLHYMVFLISFAVITVNLAVIYKVLPDVPVRWSDVLIGACLSALLFVIGKQLIAFYLGRVSFASTYGAAGSLVAILVWTYYSAQLVFFGAEFSKVYAYSIGSHAHGRVPTAEAGPEDV